MNNQTFERNEKECESIIRALKLACYAFYVREGRTGLNSWDADAYRAAIAAVKEVTGELYASGKWYVDEWGKLGENVF